MDTEFTITGSWLRRGDDLYTLIYSKAGEAVADFVEKNLDNTKLNTSPYQMTSWELQEPEKIGKIPLLVDFRDASRASDLSKHFSAINKRMEENGIYIGCFQSNSNWKKGVFKRYNKVIGYFVVIMNYLFRNLAPGWKTVKNREKYFVSLFCQDSSLAEVLGRMVFSGFEIVNYIETDNLTYYIARKKAAPGTEIVSTSRFIVRLWRIGKGGKIIKIYKVRTMYPFSEFLQDYIVRLNGYNKIGKPRNDFRLTSCGRIIRKLWIDEIPQLINLVKGDIKIVGVRPISRYGFNSLPRDLQDKRIRYKPGLIPPSVSLRIRGFKGVIDAEKIYLEEKGRRPFTTDIKYFFLALFNIVTFRVKTS